jgi:hypothetical protein
MHKGIHAACRLGKIAHSATEHESERNIHDLKTYAHWNNISLRKCLEKNAPFWTFVKMINDLIFFHFDKSVKIYHLSATIVIITQNISMIY